MKIDWISYLAQNHLPRLLQGDRTLEIYWSLAWLSWLDEKSWSYESRQVRYIFVLELVLEWNVRSGTLHLGKLAVQPQFLILGDCSVVLGTTEIPVLAGIFKRIFCSAHHSAYYPHHVFLSSFLTVLYWPHKPTVFHRLQNTKHYHPQVLILCPAPQDKEENSSTTADVICQLSSCFLSCRWW